MNFDDYNEINFLEINEEEKNQLLNYYRKKTRELKNELEETRMNRSKLHMVGEITHLLSSNLRSNLQTLINSITIVQNLHPYDDVKTVQEELKRINRITFEMIQEVEETMNFVKTRPLDIQKISVKKILNFIQKDLDIPPGIEIRNESEKLSFFCDQQLIILTFSIILVNSISQMNGIGIIKVSGIKKDKFIQISISNSGPYYSENKMIKMFDPIYSVDDQESNLGLASCKEIIKSHGGQIHVKNSPNEFIIKIPNEVVE